MEDDRTANEHHAAAIYAAQLIGLDLVSSYDELPVGFRLNWQDANRAGWFFGCDTIGGFKRAYCAFVCRTVEPRFVRAQSAIAEAERAKALLDAAAATVPGWDGPAT